jgi:RES domain-containing protein
LTLLAYRVTQSKFVSDAFDGEGARLHGGRWNSIDTRVVYVASSLSLATLEILVHIEDYATIHDLYSFIPVEFDESLVSELDVARLPKGWDSPSVIAETQQVGDNWVANAESLILRVPSIVTTGESNYLINPQHPDFPKLSLKSPYKFQPDRRLSQTT